AQLLPISVCISSCAITYIISVPSRQVYTKLHSVVVGRLHKFLYHVSFPLFPRRCSYAVTCRCGRPQTKTIMMLRYRNQSFETSRGRGGGNLLRIKMLRVEDLRISIAKSPFFIL